MESKKTALIIIASILVLSTLIFFIPTESIIGRIPLLNIFYNNTSLEVATQKGIAKVWVEGKEYGETPTTIENLSEGSYTVELERVAKEGSFYEKVSIPVEVNRNTTTRIDLEIGPSNILHGSILYYTPIKSSNQEGFLTILSGVEDAKVFIDKEFIKNTPITNLPLREGQFEIKVSADGYEDVEIPVLIRNNYNLNLKTYHFPIPVTFETADVTNE